MIILFTLACAGAPTTQEPPAPTTERVTPKGPSYEKLIEVARKLAEMSQSEKSRKYANEAKELDPTRGGAWGVLGLLAAQKMDLDAAVAAYQNASI